MTRSGLVALTLLALVTTAFGEEIMRRTLVGIKTMSVSVSITGAPDGTVSDATVQTDVELRLRQSGLRIVDVDKADAVLEVDVIVLQDSEGRGFVYRADLNVWQSVFLPRVARTTAAKTWYARGVVGMAGTSRFTEVVRQVLRDKTDEFLNAYLAANPK